MTLIIAMTGATGFAGQHVLRRLLADGHRVRALARDPRRLQTADRLDIVEGDLRQSESLYRLVQGADIIVNVAGAVAARSSAEFRAINVAGTRFLADAARQARVKRFVHVSSLAAREPSLSAYADSKREAEEVLAGQVNSIIIRPPAVYGPGDRGTLPLMQQLLKPLALIPSRQSARFSLIYVEDLAEIVTRQASEAQRGIIEVHDGKAGGYDWNELMRVARSQENVPQRLSFLPKALPLAVAYAVTPLQFAVSRPLMVTPGKIRELYHADWVCRNGLTADKPTGFPEGFRRTIAWYRQEGWLPPPRRPDRKRAIPPYGETAE
jgi:nucleoside-diphosphate-sugar epimerase